MYWLGYHLTRSARNATIKVTRAMTPNLPATRRGLTPAMQPAADDTARLPVVKRPLLPAPVRC